MTVSEDILSNLAHVYLLQLRFAEAENLYKANLKSITRSGRSVDAGQLSSLCECMAMAEFCHNRHDEALRSLLRSSHQEPHGNGLRVWYNIAVVREAIATKIASKKGKTVKNIQDAMDELVQAQKIFGFLSSFKSQFFDYKVAAQHADFCKVSLRVLRFHATELKFQTETFFSL